MKTKIAAIALAVSTVMVSAVSPVAAIGATSQPAVEISSVGGFIAPAMRIGAVPNLMAYTNGTVLTNDAVSSRPDLIVLNQRTVPYSAVKAGARAIHAAAVTPKGGWGIPGVADVPDTHTQVWISGLKVNVSVFALTFTNGSRVTAAQAKARKKLSKAIDDLTAAVLRHKAKLYAPLKYELWLLSDVKDTGGVGIANPASVFCASMGGTGVVVDSADGQYSNCQLPDGTSKEEWAYFRETAPMLNQWPDALKVPAQKCTVVAAKTFAKALASKNQTGLWLLPGGQAMPALFRPVLQGETGCQR